MSGSEKVSVIIPIYNAEKTIVETVQSVQKQTFTNFEIIAINDGSTDSTLSLLEAIDDERLKVFTCENGGVSRARNRGISLASGEFIAFLDSDDLWLPDKLECQLEVLRASPEAGLAYSWVDFVDMQGNFLYSQPPIFHEGNVYPQLLVKNFLTCGSTPLIRKEAIDSTGEFDPSLQPSEDWDYYLRIASNWHFKLVQKYQVLYRTSPRSLSSNIEAMERAQLQTIEKAFRSAPSNLYPYKQRSLSYAFQYLVSLYLNRDTDPQRFRKSGIKLLQSIRSSPSTLFDQRTQRLLIKWLVMRFLPPSILRLLMTKQR